MPRATCTTSRCRRETSCPSESRVKNRSSSLSDGTFRSTSSTPSTPLAFTPRALVEANGIYNSFDSFTDQICDYLT